MDKGQNEFEDKYKDIEIHKPMGEQMFGCFFEILLKLFCKPSTCGEIILSAGKQEIFIKTCFCPSEVWLSVKEPEGNPGCGPHDDSFNIRYAPDGFILIANTASPRREIQWKAIG